MEQFASKFLADIADKMKYPVEIRNPATGTLHKEGTSCLT